jgi:hypothetical protein
VRPQRLVQLHHPLQRQLSGNLDRHNDKGQGLRSQKAKLFGRDC